MTPKEPKESKESKESKWTKVKSKVDELAALLRVPNRDLELIKKGCEQLSELLTSPVRNEVQKKPQTKLTYDANLGCPFEICETGEKILISVNPLPEDWSKRIIQEAKRSNWTVVNGDEGMNLHVSLNITNSDEAHATRSQVNAWVFKWCKFHLKTPVPTLLADPTALAQKEKI